MKRDAIERLAIDSAAGELNEDAERLLQSYLAEHPPAKRWAEDIRQMYDQTEAAIKAKTAHARVEKAAPRAGLASQVRSLPIVRLAATVVLGTIMGFAAGRWGQTETTRRIALQETSRVLKPVETVSDLKEKYAGTFWGDKMLAFLEHKPGQRREANLLGIRSWDTYRQYMKEKNHE